MARRRTSLVYVGIKNYVVALDRSTGEAVWSTTLKGAISRSMSFVTVLRDAEGILATCGGEIFCLDPKDGTILWQNPLKGLGTGLTTMATDAGGSVASATTSVFEESQRRAAAAAAAATM